MKKEEEEEEEEKKKEKEEEEEKEEVEEGRGGGREGCLWCGVPQQVTATGAGPEKVGGVYSGEDRRAAGGGESPGWWVGLEGVGEGRGEGEELCSLCGSSGG